MNNSLLIKTLKQKLEKSETDAFLEIFDVGESRDTGELAGLAVAIKDNILYEGHHASAGSKILENYVAPYSSTVVERLLDAGAVIVGRTNMDEFAMGSSTENSAYKKTKNPHDLTRVPGGSSGGSAAAVAEGLVPLAFGTDTGGSVRQPAAFCGVVGFKPSYGAISRYGLIAMGSSLDQAGILTLSVKEARTAFNVVRGRDVRDSTSIDIDEEVAPVRTIGIPRNLIEREGIDSDVLENFNRAMDALASGGYTIQDVDIEHVEKSLAIYYVVMPAEVSSNLARYDGVRYGKSVATDTLFELYSKSRGEGFGDEVRRRIMLGTYVLSAGYSDAYYRKAQALRGVIRKGFDTAFETVDVIATPTTPTPAFKIGERTNDPLAMYLADIFTVPASITGLPAISIPSGTVEREGKALPLGLQFIAPYKKDLSLFTLGQDSEKII
ncbi:MAG: Asp-tRNA(Asn)/Glu-tRNA(Gln) amidotransferase subunit GatA [Candidatus Paceibacterota bacterium]